MKMIKVSARLSAKHQVGRMRRAGQVLTHTLTEYELTSAQYKMFLKDPMIVMKIVKDFGEQAPTDDAPQETVEAPAGGEAVLEGDPEVIEVVVLPDDWRETNRRAPLRGWCDELGIEYEETDTIKTLISLIETARE